MGQTVVPSREPPRAGPPEQDHALMAEVRAGSPTALGLLAKMYWTPLVRFVARQVGDLDTAKDIVQEVFIQVWDRREAWVSRGSPKAYLFRLARSLMVDELRRRRSLLRWTGLWQRQPRPDPITPLQLVREREIEEAYEAAIKRLPDRRREAFSLVHLGGLSYQEAAELMGISRQTLANQMSAALKQLREALGALLD